MGANPSWRWPQLQPAWVIFGKYRWVILGARRRRAEYNFISRGPSPGVFRRIYHITKDQPIHNDVGLIFVEITQPTRSNVDQSGMVAVCMDKPAIPLDQSPGITARVRQLIAHRPSM